MYKARSTWSIITFLVILMLVIQQGSLVTARLILPYKEGDWFRYRCDIRVGDQRCWFEFEMRILEIDTTREIVYVEIETLRSGGSVDTCKQLGLLFESFETRFDLRKDYRSTNYLVNPNVSGRFKLDDSIIVIYYKGVLKEAKFSTNILGLEVEVNIRLVDSSVPGYKGWFIWLIITVVVVAVAVVIVVVLVMLRRKTRAMYSVQYPPSPQYPQPSQPPAT